MELMNGINIMIKKNYHNHMNVKLTLFSVVIYLISPHKGDWINKIEFASFYVTLYISIYI